MTEPFCPIPTARSLRFGFIKGKYQLDADGELEQLCSHCREYWPADTEFYNRTGDGLFSWCKACCNERERKPPISRRNAYSVGAT